MLDLIQKYPFIMAFILGLLPALIWLWFWLKEDIHPEPAKMITLSFLGGMIAVLFVLPLQKIVYDFTQGHETLSFTLWASIEEIMKFVFVYFIAKKKKKVTEIFLMEQINYGDLIGLIETGNMRFFGASLLHIMTSGIVGITMALAFYKTKKQKIYYTISVLIIAIVLHTAFNLFIMNMPPEYLFLMFGMVWVGIVVLLLMFEKVKHIRKTSIFDQPL
ncbi:MAG: PrsW family glutamic-type intramembrane protease [Candidatus Zambryskibacteria bacterium]|nr:PrsW family glutamic-type intramembrane protease [Candidatus Zambryskibacteria bacterium]